LGEAIALVIGGVVLATRSTRIDAINRARADAIELLYYTGQLAA
jgi:hypothetical protein